MSDMKSDVDHDNGGAKFGGVEKLDNNRTNTFLRKEHCATYESQYLPCRFVAESYLERLKTPLKKKEKEKISDS
jgi:hypothetical protein